MSLSVDPHVTGKKRNHDHTDSNPGPLAYYVSMLPTELPSHMVCFDISVHNSNPHVTAEGPARHVHIKASAIAVQPTSCQMSQKKKKLWPDCD